MVMPEPGGSTGPRGPMSNGKRGLLAGGDWARSVGQQEDPCTS